MILAIYSIVMKKMLSENPTTQERIDEIEHDQMIKNAKIVSVYSTVNVGGGGFRYSGEGGFGSCTYCTPKTIHEMATILNLPIHLAGDWSIVGKKGFGELATVNEFKQLLEQYLQITPNGQYVRKNYF